MKYEVAYEAGNFFTVRNGKRFGYQKYPSAYAAEYAARCYNEAERKALEQRQARTQLHNSAQAQAAFAEAIKLKNEVVRAQVLYCLIAGVENADDTMYDGDKAFRLEFKSDLEFWEYVFRSSAQCMSCERDIDGMVPHKAALNWLERRGLRG